MQKQIQLNDFDIEYCLRQSRRARNLRLTVNCDASVVVSAPFYFGENRIDEFLRSRADWLIGKIKHFKNLGLVRLKLPNTAAHFKDHRAGALQLVKKIIGEQNLVYNFKFNKVSVKNNRSRWGSCSRRGNLNFNYKILFLPVRLVEYIVAHELCHLAAFNHSKKFWELVGRQIPDYRERVKELRKYSAH